MATDSNFDLVVTEHWEAAPRVLAIEVKALGPEPLPAWSPGDHIEIETPYGLRHYSLCGYPGDERWRIAVLRESDGHASAWLHTEAAVGMTLRSSPPRSRFPLEDSPEYLFIAGGIGITPIMAMIDDADTRGVPWRLLYGAQDSQAFAFSERLRGFGDRVELWSVSERGLPLLERAVAEANADASIYACGPSGMLDALQVACTDAGRPLHLERFQAGTALIEEGDGSAFEIVLARSQMNLHVPADRSILDVVLEAGVDAPWSCREGFCGTCETAVLEGVPDHRDIILTDQERDANNRMCICVSRAHTTQLTLDL
ncbi:PDR/VanB family oxidoreductase [Streptomyces prunicolor]|uniref:PDR/VanB family oxidoreductase n=1 Tax=Streptomyces prunicolor TaxID=67348 RepID=A0ABU4FE70_9ACTN|nr:PDR/VanB family oxidoreductase [Streptomyces prunicolor]MCX5239860.1 PDR/VanB family oxidoreductase [Streptomyces prunicolor]MDV7218881.1 PDR/VanB family oxidoreductase [Streptomyces prunicolor]